MLLPLLLLCLLAMGDPPVDTPATPGLDREALARDVRACFDELIALDTTNSPVPVQRPTQPNGYELQVADWLHAACEREFGPDFEQDYQSHTRFGEIVFLRTDRNWAGQGVETHRVELASARAVFIARIRAGDRRRRPVLLVAHMDVAPADPERWATPPFVSTERAGYLHGRGAVDSKGPLAAHFAAFLALARNRSVLKRDIVLVATSGGEGGSGVGLDLMLQESYHAKWLGAPEFALISESGRVRLTDGQITSVGVQLAESAAENPSEDQSEDLAESDARLHPVGTTAPPPPATSPDTPLYRRIVGVMAEMAPHATVTPVVDQRISEASVLRLNGIETYGLVPLPLTDDDWNRSHGPDERVPIEALTWGAEAIYRILVGFDR